MRLHTPAQLETLTGLSVGNQRAWRANGIFQDHGERTKGGHWRFRDSDVLFVSVVRAINALGVELAIAAKVGDMVLGEITAMICRHELFPTEQTHPYVFIWHIKDTSEEILKETSAVSAVPGTRYCAFRLADPARIPVFSETGGFLLVPSGLIKRLPQAVIDLFQQQEGETV